jgi:hypothetical protein
MGRTADQGAARCPGISFIRHEKILPVMGAENSRQFRIAAPDSPNSAIVSSAEKRSQPLELPNMRRS